jgi:hypothetical protein
MTSKGEVIPHGKTAKRAAEVVRAHPGKTAAELAELTGWSPQHTSKALTAARKAGTVTILRTGYARWWPADTLDETKRLLRTEQRSQALALHRLSNLRQVERRAAMAADADGSPRLSDKPIQRRADARAPLPFKCRAPASVFHLGGVL